MCSRSSSSSTWTRAPPVPDVRRPSLAQGPGSGKLAGSSSSSITTTTQKHTTHWRNRQCRNYTAPRQPTAAAHAPPQHAPNIRRRRRITTTATSRPTPPPAAVAVAAGTVTAASLDSDLVCIGIVIAKALAFAAADAAAAAAAIAAAIYVMMHAIRIAFPVEYRSWHGEEVKIERRARESRAERRRQKVLAGTWEAEQAAKRKLEEVGSDR